MHCRGKQGWQWGWVGLGDEGGSGVAWAAGPMVHHRRQVKCSKLKGRDPAASPTHRRAIQPVGIGAGDAAAISDEALGTAWALEHGTAVRVEVALHKKQETRRARTPNDQPVSWCAQGLE